MHDCWMTYSEENSGTLRMWWEQTISAPPSFYCRHKETWKTTKTLDGRHQRLDRTTSGWVRENCTGQNNMACKGVAGFGLRPSGMRKNQSSPVQSVQSMTLRRPGLPSNDLCRYFIEDIPCVKNAQSLASCCFDKHGLILIVFSKQHQHTFKNNVHIQLFLSLHFCLRYLLFTTRCYA